MKFVFSRLSIIFAAFLRRSRSENENKTRIGNGIFKTTNDMGRILAIDYGRKRTGIAVSDSLRLIANGLKTVPTAELDTFLDGYLQQEKVDVIVVGQPKQMNNQPSESMKYIEPFFNRLRKRYPEISVVYYDERFTSVLAQRAMIDGGVKKKDRQNKSLTDFLSATIILQGYMESNASAMSLPSDKNTH